MVVEGGMAVIYRHVRLVNMYLWPVQYLTLAIEVYIALNQFGVVYSMY